MHTYQEAYDMIIQAYYRDEIRPMDCRFCFCGTLNEREPSWMSNEGGENEYTAEEFANMETALLTHLIPFGAEQVYHTPGGWGGYVYEGGASYEDALFRGMSDALDVLKEIHESRGEVIEEFPVFRKRKHLQRVS